MLFPKSRRSHRLNDVSGRKALDVPLTTEGTFRLRSNYAKEEPAIEGRKKAVAKERYQIFHDNAFDLVRDLGIDPETGLLQWSGAAWERKRNLLQRVAEYFERRREDD